MSTHDKGTPYQFVAKIPDQLGFQVISDDGAVLFSSGDLQNKDSFATVITKMVHLADANQVTDKPIKRLTITYQDHFYAVSMSGNKTFVVKRPFPHDASSSRSEIV